MKRWGLLTCRFLQQVLLDMKFSWAANLWESCLRIGTIMFALLWHTGIQLNAHYWLRLTIISITSLVSNFLSLTVKGIVYHNWFGSCFKFIKFDLLILNIVGTFKGMFMRRSASWSHSESSPASTSDLAFSLRSAKWSIALFYTETSFPWLMVLCLYIYIYVHGPNCIDTIDLHCGMWTRLWFRSFMARTEITLTGGDASPFPSPFCSWQLGHRLQGSTPKTSEFWAFPDLFSTYLGLWKASKFWSDFFQYFKVLK